MAGHGNGHREWSVGWGTRLALGCLLAGLAALPGHALSLAPSTPALADSPVTLSSVTGEFFDHPQSNDGSFDPSTLGNPVFSQQFPTMNFNPADAVLEATCKSYTNADYDENVRPFADMVINPDGSCTGVPAQGNSQQAGLGSLDAFQAAFTQNITITSPGQVVFLFHVDDGFILGAGPRQGGTEQPTMLYGVDVNPPASSEVNHYQVVGANNTDNSPTINAVVVDFPAAGTYPLEVDYVECCGGTLSLTMNARWRPANTPLGGPVTAADSNGGGSPSEPNVDYGQPCAADPVNCATGNMFEQFTDISIPDRGLPLALTRTYNSLSAGTDGPLGFGWTCNLCMSLSQDGNTGAVTVNEEGGSAVTFTLNAGTYSAPARVQATLTKNNDGSFTFVRRGRTTFLFSAAGQLMSEHDLNGDVLTFTYNGSQQLISVSDGAGRSLTLTYSGSHIATITDPLSHQVSFGYTDGQGNLTSVTDVNGSTSHFTYDGNHLLTTIQDARGTITNIGYDGSGRVTLENFDPTGLDRTTSWTYDGDNLSVSGGTTTVADPAGNTTIHEFVSGEQVGETIGWGDDAPLYYTFSYDPATLGLTSVTDALGNAATATYDAAGNLLTSTDPLGRTTTYTYDALHDVTSRTDPLGIVTTYQYDPRGNLLSIKRNAAGATYVPVSHLSLRHAGRHLLLCWRAATNRGISGFLVFAGSRRLSRRVIEVHRGQWYRFRGPWAGSVRLTLHVLYADGSEESVPVAGTPTRRTVRRTSAAPRTGPVNPGAAITTYHRDDPAHPGDLTSITDAGGNTWTYAYDAAGDLTAATDPSGDKTTYTYDGIGRQLTRVSPNGNVTNGNPAAFTTSYGYDNSGDVTNITDPLGHQIVRTFDANRNLISSTDARGNTTSYTYDSADELTLETRPDLTTLATGYDKDGHILSQTDGAGKSTTYGYDPEGRLASETDPLGRTTSYAYDQIGNLFARNAPLGTTFYSYDAAHELTGITYDDGTTPNVTMTYDADGRRTGMTDGTGTSTFTYDHLGRLIQAVDGPGDTVGYSYDLRGLLTGITYPDGSNVTRSFDASGRMTGVTDMNGNTTSFGYDADSNLTTETFPASTHLTDTFTFNAADQVTGITDLTGNATLASFAYTRDQNGQVTGETPDGVNESPQTYAYNSLNQLQSVNSQPYGYDAANNLTGLPSGATQTSDAANEVTQQTGGNSAAFGYDLNGNRTSLTPSAGSPATLVYDEENRLTSYGSAATYTYNGDGLRISTSTSGNPTDSFAWDLAEPQPLLLQDLQAGLTRWVYGPGGLPLEQIDNAGTVLFYHHDQLGGTRLLTNINGIVLGTASYDPGGNVTGHTGLSTPFGFAGQYRDAESGYLYLRARYYDPSTGQFLTRDPLVSTTQRPYEYAANNPLNLTDPTGQQDSCPVGYAPLPSTDSLIPIPAPYQDTPVGTATLPDNNTITPIPYPPNDTPTGSATLPPNTTITPIPYPPTDTPTGSATLPPNNTITPIPYPPTDTPTGTATLPPNSNTITPIPYPPTDTPTGSATLPPNNTITPIPYSNTGTFTSGDVTTDTSMG